MKGMEKKTQAKMQMLKALRKMGHDMSAGEMFKEMTDEPMQKVVVAAKNKEGLKKGLEKAEDVLEKMPSMESEEEESEDEMESEEDSEYSMPSEEEMQKMSKEELIACMKRMK